jgi:predicted phosphoadenosine phosphosulfate sulfurtransferase
MEKSNLIRNYLSTNVLEESVKRINYVFDNFQKVYVSFSGGKDSTVLLHLVANIARERNKQIGVLFIDWECQFEMTINHVREMFNEYSDVITPYWIQLEIMTNNSTSMVEPTWKSWDESKKKLWTREKETNSIKDKSFFPFYFENITFEEFITLFGRWYANGETTACFVGLRAQESLNRFRTIARDNVSRFNDKKYSVKILEELYNFYPLYDWKAKDIWKYFGYSKNSYNKIYDRMYQAGLTIHQMRIDEPFGDEARKNLWLYHIVEPHTWAKLVARMNGANTGSLYSQEGGNMLGNNKLTLPEGHTWESFSRHLLNTMPPKTSEHYKNKIYKYIQWYMNRGFETIPDSGDWKKEQSGEIPSWRQIAKTLLRNDYWCRNLGFQITKSSAYEKYLKLMKKKREENTIFAL